MDIGGFDVTACGGTHVARTGEIGLIKVVRYERRGDTTRLEFKCGERALGDYREKNEIINRLVNDMTVGYQKLPDAIQRMLAENKALKADLKTAREQIIETEAASLLPQATAYANLRLIISAYENRDINDLKLLAQKLTAQSGVVALLGLAGDKAQLLFGRADDVTSPDMSQMLKVALAALNSNKGGGRPNFAQGGGVPATLQDVAVALKQAEQAIRSGQIA